MAELLLTLGHNSSAIVVQDKKVVVGYEEERLSKVKSDSSFPKMAIAECMKHVTANITDIYVSHWFNTEELEDNKYWQQKYIEANFKNAKIHTLNKDFTHHDAHAQSVWNFSGTEEGLTVVADGFGNNAEVLSLYVDGVLDHRAYQYSKSLGLMYQYATSYLGLKENQDEYKLLGYEIHCKANIDDFAASISADLVKLLQDTITKFEYDMSVDLAKVKEKWYKIFDTVKAANHPDEEIRPLIAKLVQKVIETVILNFIAKYKAKFVQLSGGIFYNVKLNNAVLRHVDKLVINPLCGDQGCGLGMIKGLTYNDLYFGKREDSHFYLTPQVGTIAEFIKTEGFYDVMYGSMEFGPRALGHTTTYAKPLLENVEKINSLNRRSTIMPMAPVVTREFFEENFKDTEKIIKSEKYMICSFDFKTMKDEWRGAAHYDPDRDVYTGRVQVVDEGWIYTLVDMLGGILINTSSNFHGCPINFTLKDHNKMMEARNEKI